MADNVFGVPITDGTLTERVSKALNNPNADGKRDAALAYVRERKAEWGTGVSTLAIFYNATGETMTYTTDNSAYGHIYGTYPSIVQNGQWGAFLHVKNTGAASGSEAFVVYRVRVDDTKVCNPLIAWSTPWDQAVYDNLAYCDIFDEGKVDPPNDVYKKMEERNKAQCVVIKLGMMVTSNTGSGTSPEYEAEFTREDAKDMKKSADQDAVEASQST